MPEALEFPLVADLPEDWVGTNAITPNGTEASLTPQHGYNYLMRKVNEALIAANELQEAIVNFSPGENVPPASEEDEGKIQIATTEEVATGTNDGKAITPLKLQQRLIALAATLPAADKLTKGIIRIATLAEVLAGESPDTAITPESLFELLEDAEMVIAAATTAKKGIIRIASKAEVTAGVATDIAVTPATLQDKLAAVAPNEDSAFKKDLLLSNWTIKSLGVNGLGMSWSPKLKMIVAIQPICTCYYGDDWVARTTPNGTWNAIAWMQSIEKYIVVGTSTSTLESANGISWTVNSGVLSFSGLNCICDTGLICVALGNNGVGAYTSDGKTWTKFNMPLAANWRQIIEVGKSPNSYSWRLFALHGSGTSNASIARSSSGFQWELIPMPAGTFLCMCYAKDRLIVLGSNVGTYSRDGGDTWVSVVVPEGTYWTIAWHETLQILIGFSTSGPNIVSTDLGETWKQLLHIPGTTGYGSSIWIPELKKAITIVNAKQYSMLDYIPGIGG